MVQTKLVLRLIKDGKDVGRMRIRKSKVSTSMFIEQSRNDDIWFSIYAELIDYDSFELLV